MFSFCRDLWQKQLQSQILYFFRLVEIWIDEFFFESFFRFIIRATLIIILRSNDVNTRKIWTIFYFMFDEITFKIFSIFTISIVLIVFATIITIRRAIIIATFFSIDKSITIFTISIISIVSFVRTSILISIVLIWRIIEKTLMFVRF